MLITKEGWTDYISKLRRLNNRAAILMQRFVDANGMNDIDEVIRYAYSLTSTYGEAAATLACEMYDMTAIAQGASVASAVPARTASFSEVAALVNGNRNYPRMIISGVSRMVKQAGADTTVNNALRDHAEWAWIPSGDTCAFCITLASQGWVRASKKVLKGTHAEHIHANCDCNFQIRFDSSLEVQGYNPEEYRERYESADGWTSKQKIHALRQEIDSENREKINAQKRELYAEDKKVNDEN